MRSMLATDEPPGGFRLRPRIWIGVIAVGIDVALAGGLGDLTGSLAPPGDAVADFALGHFIPLPVALVLVVVFLRLSGWGHAAWRSASVIGERHRWWMLAIPLLFAVQIAIGLATEPWGSIQLSTVLIVLAGTAMVGIAEELYLRGILRVAVLGNHSETAALLITSAAFGLAHVLKLLLAGAPITILAFQVVFLAMDGALFYGALRATGTLWVPIGLHALNDFQLYLHSGNEDGAGQSFGEDPITVTAEVILIALSVALLFSTIRHDLRRGPAPDRSSTIQS